VLSAEKFTHQACYQIAGLLMVTNSAIGKEHAGGRCLPTAAQSTSQTSLIRSASIAYTSAWCSAQAAGASQASHIKSRQRAVIQRRRADETCTVRLHRPRKTITCGFEFRRNGGEARSLVIGRSMSRMLEGFATYFLDPQRAMADGPGDVTWAHPGPTTEQL
jgi:hypothetical protein